MKVIIVGGGRIGEKLSELLVNEKCDVVIVERNEKIAEELGEKLDALVLRGDATDRKILKDGNIEKCDAMVALTGDDKTNLMICEIAKDFKVPKIISRIVDSSNENIFTKLGITASINTTTSAILAFKRILDEADKKLVSFVAGEKAEVFEMTVKKKSQIANKKVKDFDKHEFSIAGIFRDGQFIKPRPDQKILEGDVVVICSPVKEVAGTEKLF